MCDFNLSLFNYTVDKNTELLQEIPAGGYKVNIIAKSMFSIIYNTINITLYKRELFYFRHS